LWDVHYVFKELGFRRSTCVPEVVYKNVTDLTIFGKDFFEFLPFMGGGEFEGTLTGTDKFHKGNKEPRQG
jgi:hypothetical protein